MIFEKLLQGQPEGIFGIGYNDPSTVGIICTIILLILVVCGVRVVIAASIAGMIGLVELIGIGPALGNIGAIPYSKSVTFVLGLLPIFILIGFLAYQAGITRQLFEAAKAWVGFVPGGLAVATVFATAGFAAVSGASTATAAVFSRIAIPEMLKEGYDKKLAAGVVALHLGLAIGLIEAFLHLQNFRLQNQPSSYLTYWIVSRTLKIGLKISFYN